MHPPAGGPKAELRVQLLTARRAVPQQVRAEEAEALAATLGEFTKSRVGAGETVCAYVPVNTEPGSLDLLDDLVAAGRRVLLPIAVTADDGTPLPLRWAPYRHGELRKAKFGLREPTSEALPPEALAEARVVIVPALAVDRRGNRLGRGGGFYDRSLPLRDPAAALVAVVRVAELVDELPADAHDISMTHAAMPGGVLAFSSA